MAQRFVWVVFPPDFAVNSEGVKNKNKRPRVFGNEQLMIDTCIPQAFRNKRRLSPNGRVWTFTSSTGKKIVARKLLIEDSQGLPL